MRTVLICVGIIAWVACWVLTYGLAVAFTQNRWPTVRKRTDWVFPLLMGVFGPLSLGAFCFAASAWGNPFKYGVQWHSTDAS